MGLSLNPLEVFKLFADHKKADKEKIATWLEKAADDARRIANIWTQNRDDASELEQRPEGALHANVNYGISNFFEFGSFSESRDSFSSVIGGRIDQAVNDDFANKSAAFIIRRNEVRTLYERLYGKRTPLIFFDDNNREEQLNNLDTAIELLNREASALEVIARNFRASR